MELISGWGKDELTSFFFVFLRVGAALSLLPAFGEQSIPQRVRLGLAIAFTAVVYPAVSVEIRAYTMAEGQAWGGYASEILVGLILGLGLRLFVFSLQMAGSIAAQATSLSQILGSAQAEPTAAIGQLLLMAGLALAVMNGLHIRIAEAFILSYNVFGPGDVPQASDVSQWGVARIASAFSLAFSLAAPFVIASLVYNVALGVINRAMPQLMVAMVGAPAITLGGMALLLIVAPVLLAVWWDELSVFLQAPFGVMK
ncbi:MULTISPECIES: flagellar biosynthetic protein FliR [Falsihalocynthiibacter]|uniref:flagellar biosynthetic protein FliR n=1 Tax=Falsihalocynthiibacter TaxID=2854182 RepID=UPI00300242FC